MQKYNNLIEEGEVLGSSPLVELDIMYIDSSNNPNFEIDEDYDEGRNVSFDIGGYFYENTIFNGECIKILFQEFSEKLAYLDKLANHMDLGIKDNKIYKGFVVTREPNSTHMGHLTGIGTKNFLKSLENAKFVQEDTIVKSYIRHCLNWRVLNSDRI